jgi:hypothetical protein
MSRGEVRTRKSQEDVEDILPQAGWMYADLFLALTVIFLATISFVPKSGQVDNLNTPKNTNMVVNTATSFNYAKGYTLLVPIDQFDQVPEKVTEFLVQEKLDKTTEIIFAQIVGGFNPATEKANDGKLRAIKFSLELNKKYPALLINAQRYVDSSPVVASTNVALRLTFARAISAK